MKKEKDTIVFDLETKGVIPKNTSRQERMKVIRVLKVSVICAYSYNKNEFFFYTESNIQEFFKLLKNATKIVGFNIIHFDYEVLKKYGLPNGLMSKTVDLFDRIRQETGNWYSLDRLSQENLGRGKLFKGKELGSMEGVDLYRGCKADVQITKELYDLWVKGQLKYGRQRWSRNRYVIDDDYGDMSDYIPFNTCPFCGNTALEKFDEFRDGMGIDGMSEGELAEYLAGTWGTVYCLKCGKSFDYD